MLIIFNNEGLEYRIGNWVFENTDLAYSVVSECIIN